MNKLCFKRSVQLLLFIVLFAPLMAQSMGRVVALHQDYLLSINIETAELSVIKKLDLPANTQLQSLVYVPKDFSFYSILQSAQAPQLVRINHSGQCQIVGNIELTQSTVYTCKALTYDRQQDRLLLSVSTARNKQKANQIITVNRQTAQAQTLAHIRQDPAPDDFDQFAVYKDRIYCFDLVDHRKLSYVFPFHLAKLQGQLFSGSKQNIPFFNIKDLLIIGEHIYFVDNNSQQLYSYNILSQKWRTIAPIKAPASLGRIQINGLSLLPLSQA